LELGNSIRVIDEVHGFRYFDDRDLTGFVDGTENPDGALRLAANGGGTLLGRKRHRHAEH
jgi:putative iron-dependent peroxidase